MSQKDKSKLCEGSCQKTRQGRENSKQIPPAKSPIKSRTWNMFRRRPSADTREGHRDSGILLQGTTEVNDAPPPYPAEESLPAETPPKSPLRQTKSTPGGDWSLSGIIPPDCRDFMKVESAYQVQADIEENPLRRASSQPRLALQEPGRTGSSRRWKRRKQYSSQSSGLNEQCRTEPSTPRQSFNRHSGRRGARNNDYQHHHGDPRSPPTPGTVINVTASLSPCPLGRSTSAYQRSSALLSHSMTDLSHQSTTRYDHLFYKCHELENKLDFLQLTCDSLFQQNGYCHNSGYEGHLSEGVTGGVVGGMAGGVAGGVDGGMVSLLEMRFQEQVDSLKCYNSEMEAKMKADIDQIAAEQARLKDENEQLKRLIFYKSPIPQTPDSATTANYQYRAQLQGADTMPSYSDLDSIKFSIHLLCRDFLAKLQEIAKRLPLNSQEATTLPHLEAGREVQRLQVAMAALQQEVTQSQQRMRPTHPFHHQLQGPNLT